MQLDSRLSRGILIHYTLLRTRGHHCELPIGAYTSIVGLYCTEKSFRTRSLVESFNFKLTSLFASVCSCAVCSFRYRFPLPGSRFPPELMMMCSAEILSFLIKFEKSYLIAVKLDTNGSYTGPKIKYQILKGRRKRRNISSLQFQSKEHTANQANATKTVHTAGKEVP